MYSALLLVGIQSASYIITIDILKLKKIFKSNFSESKIDKLTAFRYFRLYSSFPMYIAFNPINYFYWTYFNTLVTTNTFIFVYLRILKSFLVRKPSK